MKKTLLATSIALTLGFSAQTYAQPSFDDINFADDGSTSMEDGNLIGNTATVTNDLDATIDASTTNTADVDANVDASTNDSNNSISKSSADTITKTDLDLNADVDLDASTNDSNNSITKSSADTITKTALDLDADVDVDASTNDSNNTATITKTSADTVTKTSTDIAVDADVDVSRTSTADNGSISMNDGNTVTNTNTEITIGDINVDTAVNQAELTASVSGNTITMTAGGLEALPGSIDASNNISGGSMNFTGVGLATQNTGAAASTQASINVQSNLAF